jgi:hypothetical protein
MVGKNRSSHHIPRLSVDAGGDVQSEDRLSAHIDQLNRVPIDAVDLTIQARSEYGIHDSVAVDNRRAYH